MNSRVGFVALITVLAIGLRWFSAATQSDVNLAAVGALSLFAGSRIPDRRWSFVVGPVAMLISDIGLWMWFGYPPFVAVYAVFALISVGGWLLKETRNPFKIAGGAIASSVFFFVLTNLFVWLRLGPDAASAPESLVQTYWQAIPFFRNTAVSDLLFSGLFFGAWELVAHTASNPQRELTTAAIPANTVDR